MKNTYFILFKYFFLFSSREKFLIVIALYFTGLLTAQNKLPELSKLVSSSHAQRTIELNPFFEKDFSDRDSITVFNQFHAIEELAYKLKDEDLKLEVGWMRLLYTSHQDYADKDSIVRKLTQMNDFAKSKNKAWLELKSLNLLANFLFNIHNEYGLGYEYFERVAQLLEGMSTKEFPLKRIYLFHLARAYYYFDEHEKVISLLRKVEKMKSPLESYFYEMRILAMLGVSYRNIKKLDSSSYYFKLAYDNAKKFNDPVWKGISSGDLGENYLIQGEVEKAKSLITFDAKIALENEDWGLASNAHALLSQIELEREELAKADSLIRIANSLARNSNQYYRFSRIYPLQSKIAAHQSNPELAAVYLDSTLMAKDSLAKLYDAKKIVLAKQRIQVEKQKLKEQKAQQAIEKKLWLRNGLIFSLFLLLIILLLLYNRYLLQSKSKAQRLLLEKHKAMEDLNAAKKRLENFKQSLLKKNKTILELQKQQLHSSDPKFEMEESLKRTSILTEEDAQKFTLLFNQVHPGFFKRLKKQYPKLTPAETRYFALSRLKLNTKEMALMLGVSNSAVRQIKSRLLRKIDLEPYTSEEEFAAHI